MQVTCYNHERFGAFRSGDRAALGEYYELYAARIYQRVFRKTGDPALASDICEDAFVELGRKPLAIENEDHLIAFLHKTANIKVEAHFRERAMKKGFIAELSRQTDGEISGNNREMELLQIVAELRKAFLNLSARKRRILVLYDFHDNPTHEIANRLGICDQTVRNHRSQALDELRKQLLGRWGGRNPLFS